MSTYSLLKRQIEFESCRLVGQQLRQHIEEWSKPVPTDDPNTEPKPEIELHEDVQEVVGITLEKAKVLDTLAASPNLRDVDRGADSFISAFFGGQESLLRCYNHTHLLPLTDEEKLQEDIRQRLLYRLFPSGITFIQKSDHIQWSQLRDIRNAMADQDGNLHPEVESDFKALGLLVEARRFLRWIQTYGEAIGSDKVTEQLVEKRARARREFLEAWEALSVEIRSKLRKTPEGKLKEAYLTILSLYDKQAEKEYEIEKRREEALKKAKEKEEQAKKEKEEQARKEKEKKHQG